MIPANLTMLWPLRIIKANTLSLDKRESKPIKLLDKEKPSSHAMQRTSSVEKCLPLIGLIKKSGVQARLKRRRTKDGEKVREVQSN